MQQALQQASVAAQCGEVPVGAVLVLPDGQQFAAHNAPISSCDASAHAEIQVIRAACKAINNYRLVGAQLFVTLEPCAMCAGAIIHARIARVAFGLFYALVVLFSHMALAHFGQQGLLTVAGLSGLSDVDAITLSLAEMTQQHTSIRVAAQGIMLACAANSMVKLGIGLSFAPKTTHRWLTIGLLPMVLLSLAAVYIL